MDDAPGSDPLAVLVDWHREATGSGAREPDAMTLATATATGRVSARVVLFKGIREGRVQFVSNHASRKGREIAENSRVALVLFWPELMRQVRIEGRAELAPADVSDAYFRIRERASQLGAWASDQSAPIGSREQLEARYRAAEARFEGREVERPEGWGVYWVTPRSIELWLSRPHRLHDRFLYERAGESWLISRLCP